MSLEITGQYRCPSPRSEWLARTYEEILEPELPIVDPHHHIWIQESNRCLLEDLVEDISSGHDILATVFVEARFGFQKHGDEQLHCVGKTEKVVELASEARRRGLNSHLCAGIVGHAELQLGDRVQAVLEAHIKATQGRFRGVRQSVARSSHYPEGFVLRAAPAGLRSDYAFRTGLRGLALLGLSYDAMLYHEQIAELTETARAVPDLPRPFRHFTRRRPLS